MENLKDFTEIENVTINPAKLDGIDYDYAGRGIVEHFENKPKRHKIKMRKALENEIDEERKRVTLNTFAIGVSALATVVFALSVTNADLEACQRMGSLLISSISSKGLYDSVKMLNDAIKRKAKLENTYFDTYNEEYEEKRGKSL